MVIELKKKFKKLVIIVLSRFKKPNQEQWIKDRRKECAVCPFNTLNLEKNKLSFNKKLLQRLSRFYSIITGNKDVDVLGECTACETCSVYYKSSEPTSYCEKNRWKK